MQIFNQKGDPPAALFPFTAPSSDGESFAPAVRAVMCVSAELFTEIAGIGYPHQIPDASQGLVRQKQQHEGRILNSEDPSESTVFHIQMKPQIFGDFSSAYAERIGKRDYAVIRIPVAALFKPVVKAFSYDVLDMRRKRMRVSRMPAG